MFTGIIEEVGYVKSFLKNSEGATLNISCCKVLEDIHLGDSICVNGVCETVVAFDKSGFTVNISPETLSVTNFCAMESSDSVNLERALTLQTRLGGHIVSGHIDCVGKLLYIEKISDYYNLKFEIPTEYSKYIVYKGSVTVNGISLTVSSINENTFTVAIIPHTYENTMLKELNIGEYVNIETDILGKYVEKILSANNNVVNNRISMEFLEENGFV